MSNVNYADNTILNRVFDEETNTLRIVTNPGSASSGIVQYEDASYASGAQLAAGTHYFPSTDGAVLGTYRSVSLLGNMQIAAGSIIASMEVTNHESPSAADWIQVYGYDAVGNGTENFVSASAGNTTKFAWYFDDLNARKYRVKVYLDDALSSFTLKARKTT